MVLIRGEGAFPPPIDTLPMLGFEIYLFFVFSLKNSLLSVISLKKLEYNKITL